MLEYIPYVYIIKNKTTKMKYLGVRYAKGCNPVDLWTTYFTSSSLVKKLINQFGKDDFIVKVIHQYPNDPKAAILREAKYFECIKKRDDFLNITYSSGCQDLRVASKGGKVGGSIVYAKKIGIFRSDEDRKKWASDAGKIGGAKQRDLKLGIHGLSKEQRLKNCSKGGKNGGFTNSELQRELGKRGGPKNKGFVWLTDGITSIKYSPKMQKIKSVERFLEENPSFHKGRTLCQKLKQLKN